VQQWLSSAEAEVEFVLNWTDSLAAGLDRLAQGSVGAVLLDLGLPDSNGLETFQAIHNHAPGLPIVILSAADGESLALRVIQEGAEDYLVKSTCTGDQLIRTLRYAVLRHKRRASEAGSDAVTDKVRVIGVVGAKGGVGATTVACTLAAALRTETGQSVLLVDLNVNSGSAAFLMGLDSKHSTVDAINNLGRLDRTFWDTLVVRTQSGLQVIASPSLMGNDEVPAEGLRRLFTLIRPFYQWIVVDLGRSNQAWQSLAGDGDELFVVTTTALPALYDSKRVSEALLRSGMERTRLRFIVNQTEDIQAMSGSELKHFFGIPVSLTLPKVSQEVHEACCQGKLPAETGAIGRKMTHLARELADLKERKARRNFPQFLSFVERFRRSTDDVAVVHGD